VDVPATLEKISAVYDREDELIQTEVTWLKNQRIDTVVCDIPAMPLQAARIAGIRSVAIANFSWAWIYEEFADEDPRWQSIIDRMNTAYAMADLLVRTPFSESLSVFPKHHNIGLLARPGQADRERLAELTGADPDRKWILLSFTTLEWDEAALAQISSNEAYAFFTVRPLAWDAPNLFAVDRETFLVADLFATVDAVLTKPGFGVLSECVANQKPMLYVERENFREYPVLEAAVKQYLVNTHIPAEKLYRGDISEELAAIWQAPPPPDALRLGGDVEAAKLICMPC
jgi:L-arabinokinase